MKNWNAFTKRIVINQPVDEVYRCWATQAKMETWFLEKAVYSSGDQQRGPDETSDLVNS